MTKYESYPNFDPFKRYFDKNYWEMPPLQLIMTCDIKPLILAQIVVFMTTLLGCIGEKVIYNNFSSVGN